MKKIILKLFILSIVIGGFLAVPGIARAESFGAGNPVDIYFFKNEGCPHCAAEEPYLKTIDDKYDNVTVHMFELSAGAENISLFRAAGEALHANFIGVPVTIIGTEYLSGWGDAMTSGRTLEAMIEKYAGKRYYRDPVKELLNPAEENAGGELEENNSYSNEPGVGDNPEKNSSDVFGEKKVLPIIGEVNLRQISLPVLAVILGFVDGFNPCAMWILVFLITLLLGLPNRRRMWFLGILFIFISALSYFLFMAAWLNLFLFIGMIFWVRLGIATVALIFGILNLKSFFTRTTDECPVSDLAAKKRWMDRFREVMRKNSLLAATLGIIVLGFSINLVELMCSAGFPAVFTEVLALSDISGLAYYGYIALYILFFMLDDLAVFFLAMFTLRVTGLSTKYTRVTKLVGGLLMIIIGLLLIF